MVYVSQVEVTTYCNGSCVYCPVAIYRGSWDSRHMEPTLYAKILQECRQVGIKHLHLQGWGEPLLHPNFVQMLHEASRLYDTSLTTNGIRLGQLADKILDAEPHTVAVTFAGITTHDKIRLGVPLQVVAQNLKTFVEKARRRPYRPHVTAVYMMLRETVAELPAFIDLAAEMGVDEVRLSNLSYVPHPALWSQKVYSQFFQPPPRHVVETVNTAREKAERYGLKFFHRMYTPVEHLECPETPTDVIYINVRGEVSPCPYLSLSTDTAVRCFEGRCEKAPRVIYGDLTRETLKEVLKKRRDFIAKFHSRKAADLIPPPPPDPCAKCYRLYWI